jgi:hypothetical protein
MKLLVHKIHVDLCKLEFFAQGNYSDHVPLQNPCFPLLVFIVTVRNERILWVNIDNFVSAALNHLLPAHLPRHNFLNTYTSRLAVLYGLLR